MAPIFIYASVIFFIVVGPSMGATKMNFSIKKLWNSAPITDHGPINVTLSSTAEKDHLYLEIDAPFFNDPAPPSLLPPGSFPKLWNYEVVEIHFLSSTTNHYIQIEFSPHDQYVVLLFVDRQKLLKQLLTLSDYTVERPSSDRWVGRVHIPSHLFPAHVDRFNAFAIHGQDDKRTYEALYPAPSDSEKPDFHRLELFQPIDFDSLLHLGEKDGDSWKNK